MGGTFTGTKFFFFFLAVLGHFPRLFSFSSILPLGTEEASGIIELLQMTFFFFLCVCVVALGVLGFYFFF